MKLLGIFRHAKSSWSDPSLRDFDRGLNKRGRKGAAVMGQHISGYGIAWDLVLASPAERVRRTLEASGLDVPVCWEQQAYMADADKLMALLRRIDDDPPSVLLAGHNPGLQHLILELAGAEQDNDLFAAVTEKFPTGSFAVLELAVDRWEQCRPGCGRLIHFVRPRDLDPTLAPKRDA